MEPLLLFRRAYDKSLAQSASPHRHPPPGAAFYTQYADTSWAYETRRRPGATHAWDYARRPGSTGYRHPGHNPPPGRGPYPKSHAETQYQSGQHYQGVDPFSSPSVQKATGHTRRPPMTDADRITQVSSLWRAMQVIGIVMIVVSVGGGFKASA